MEHLGAPLDPYKPIEVPYLAGPLYDDGGFHEFPKRMGLSINLEEALDDNDLLEKIEAQDWTLQRISRLVQSWLWFGSLSFVFRLCEVKVSPKDFIRNVKHSPDQDDAGEYQVLSTEKLNEYLQLAGQNEEKLPWERRNEHHEQIQSVLGTMRKWVTQSTVGHVFHAEEWEVLCPRDIELSIAVLYDGLDAFRLLVFEPEEESTSFGSPSALDANSLLTRRLIEMGWCSSKVQTWRTKFPQSVIYYMSLLGPPNVSSSHENCDKSVCQALNIKHETYVTAHTSTQCRCDHVQIDHQKIVTALKNGSYPIIAVTPKDYRRLASASTSGSEGRDRLVVEVEQWKNEVAYTAISHVWSDGLGNPRHNSLPYCQLVALYQRVKAISLQTTSTVDGKTIHLWLDSLCVPVQDHSARALAIKHMRSSYRNASNVLVLDSEIMQHSSHEPNIDLLLTLHMSNWTCRLWTLQEGVLARNLYFQFSDGALDIEAMTEELNTSSYTNTLPIPITALSFHRTLRLLSSNTGIERLYNIAEVVFQRSTTRASDEPICLATLLNLDLTSIAEAPPHEKMQRFYAEIRTLPPDIIFTSGAHIDADAWRWAPQSLLTVRSKRERLMFAHDESDGPPAVVRGVDGALEGEWSALTLTPRSPRPLARTFGARYGTTCLEIFPFGQDWVDDWSEVVPARSGVMGLLLYVDGEARGVTTPGVLLPGVKGRGEGMGEGRFWCQCRVVVSARDVQKGEFVSLQCQPSEDDRPLWWVGTEEKKELFVDEGGRFETWVDGEFAPKRWCIT